MKGIHSILPRTVRRRITFGFVTALLLIAIGFALTLYSYSQYGEDSNQIEHSHEVTNRLNLLMLSLVEVETGVRGFVATKDPLFLGIYDSAVAKIPDEIRQIRVLVADNPAHQANLDSLALYSREKLDISGRMLREVRGNAPPSILRSFMFLGKVRMDRARNVVDTMKARERKLLEQRGKDALVSFRNTLIIIFVLSLLTFVILIISYNILENELNVRQQTEVQLRGYEDELQEKIRLLEVSNEELERFAFVASHDMQEPLRKIQSFGYLLRDRYEPILRGEGVLYLNKMLQSAERMSKMIKDLLNFSRISNKGEPFKRVRLEEVINGVLSDQELKIKAAGAEVQVGPMPTLDAVVSQMDHLFSNLISNALKFTRNDVTPVIKISSESVDGVEFEELIAGKKYFKLMIEDNGIGFDEKYLDHIFKIFQRLHGKSTYEGTGIGLAICKRIVNYHKGLITAHSQPGSGATFIIVLPETQIQPIQDNATAQETDSYLISG